MKGGKNTKVLTIVLAALTFLACRVDVAIAVPKDLLNILTNIPIIEVTLHFSSIQKDLVI